MKMDEFHHRSLRLSGYDYSAAGGYYVTVVAFRRECLFGEVVAGVMRLNALGSIVMECWDEIPSHFPSAGIDACVVMPDHVHGIVFIYDDNLPFVEATHASPLLNILHSCTLRQTATNYDSVCNTCIFKYRLWIELIG